MTGSQSRPTPAPGPTSGPTTGPTSGSAAESGAAVDSPVVAEIRRLRALDALGR
ncbi:hypothetical protein G6031_07535, partial [Dietzia sp. CQ4]|nr:hypothetical protein [Dietzia sp. CQ4]